jgi:hypothetical protein
VVSILPTLGDDWSGEPAVFFMVILTDAASRRDQLLSVSNQVSEAVPNEPGQPKARAERKRSKRI